MDKVSTLDALNISPKTAQSASWTNNNTVMVIHPLVNWDILTSYRVTIAAAARSVAGAPMKQDYSATFEIKDRPAPPEVISTDPKDHTVDVYQEVIWRIVFSQPMDTKATDQSLIILPDTDLPIGYDILWDHDNQRLSFEFFQRMRPGEDYFITVTTKAMSADGVYMEKNFSFTFQVMGC